MDSSSSSQQNQNQYAYPTAAASQQPYDPSRPSYYSNYQYPHQQQPQQYQQQMYQQKHQQYPQPQHQYSSYYPPNYPNPYPPPPRPPPPQQQHPQTHQQWHHHHYQEPAIHPPGVSIQPHFPLPNQQNTYHLPQRTDGVVAVAALAQLNQLAGSVAAPGGLQGPSWYPQAQGFGPVIGGPGIHTGPGLGSGAFPQHGAGPSGSRSQAGQSLDKGGGRRRRDGRRRDDGRRRGDGQSKGGGRRRSDGQTKGGGRRRGDGQSKGDGRRRADGQSRAGGRRRRGDGQNKDVGRGKFMCEMCKVDCGCPGILRVHLNGKRHKRNLEKLEANENRAVGDIENVQKPSGDLEAETATKPDNLLVEEEAKHNSPQNIPLDTVSSEKKLGNEEKIDDAQADPPKDANRDLLEKKPMMNQSGERINDAQQADPPKDANMDLLEKKPMVNQSGEKINEAQQAEPPKDANIDLLEKKPMMNQSGEKINDAQQADPPKDANRDLLEKKPVMNQSGEKINNAQQTDPPNDANQDSLEMKPMMNQSGNQKSGVKRKELVGGRKKKKAKRLMIGPSTSNVVIPLMCDLCNVKCSTQEILRQHLSSRQHMSTLKSFEGHPIYGQVGLQAIYPPNPDTNSRYQSQVAQQVLNGAQVSDPLSAASLLPQNESAAPSAGISLN